MLLLMLPLCVGGGVVAAAVAPVCEGGPSLAPAMFCSPASLSWVLVTVLHDCLPGGGGARKPLPPPPSLPPIIMHEGGGGGEGPVGDSCGKSCLSHQDFYRISARVPPPPPLRNNIEQEETQVKCRYWNSLTGSSWNRGWQEVTPLSKLSLYTPPHLNISFGLLQSLLDEKLLLALLIYICSHTGTLLEINEEFS